MWGEPQSTVVWLPMQLASTLICIYVYIYKESGELFRDIPGLPSLVSICSATHLAFHLYSTQETPYPPYHHACGTQSPHVILWKCVMPTWTAWKQRSIVVGSFLETYPDCHPQLLVYVEPHTLPFTFTLLKKHPTLPTITLVAPKVHT